MDVKLSIIIPFHWMDNWQFFMNRCLESIEKQSFRDYEIILTKVGKMAENTNRAMECAKGELIKILYMDDYLAHKDSLKVIVDSFASKDMWLATGCLHQRVEGDYYEDPHSPHYPTYSSNIRTGNNTIGSPSVLTVRNKGHLKFDEHLSWLLDCDLYFRYNIKYGAPKLINDLNVVMGLGEHQVSVQMPHVEKQEEFNYITNL